MYRVDNRVTGRWSLSRKAETPERVYFGADEKEPRVKRAKETDRVKYCMCTRNTYIEVPYNTSKSFDVV